jgi:glycosyltransferase involved in cell wall biosynthesis
VRLWHDRLAADGWPVNLPAEFGMPDTCSGPGLVSAVSLMRFLTRRHADIDVLHLLADSTSALAAVALPTTLLAKFLGKPVLLQLSVNCFQDWIESYGWIAAPLLKQAGKIMVTSERAVLSLKDRGLDVVAFGPVVDMDKGSSSFTADLQPRILVLPDDLRPEDLETLVRALIVLKNKYPRAELVLPMEDNFILSAIRRHPGLVSISATCDGDLLARSQADILIDPRSQVDALHPTILEALARGIPIVATDDSSGPDDLTAGQNCLVYRSGKPDQLADQLLTLVEKPNLLYALRISGKAVAERYSWDLWYPRLQDAYFALARRP